MLRDLVTFSLNSHEINKFKYSLISDLYQTPEVRLKITGPVSGNGVRRRHSPLDGSLQVVYIDQAHVPKTKDRPHVRLKDDPGIGGVVTGL